MPHLFTDEQNRQQVKVAKKRRQMFPIYDKKQFAKVVAGDENWVHYFEPVRKFSNKTWATKHNRRPINCRAVFECKEGLVCNFLPWIKVPVEKGKIITRKYYKDIVLEKPKNIIRNDTLSLVLNLSVFYMAMSLLMPPK